MNAAARSVGKQFIMISPGAIGKALDRPDVKVIPYVEIHELIGRDAGVLT